MKNTHYFLHVISRYAILILLVVGFFQGRLASAETRTVDEADVTISSIDEGVNFATSMSAGGDVNHDGVADVLVGASNTNAAYLFYGSKYALSGAISAAHADVTFVSVDGVYFGNTVAIVSDMNGDGVDDISIADQGQDTFSGKVYIFYGDEDGDMNDDGITDSEDPIDAAEADKIISGEYSNGSFGLGIESIGDVNNDHLEDIVITSSFISVNDAFPGAAHIFYGTEDVDESVVEMTSADADAILYGIYFPSGMTGGKDLNADGIDDFILGNEEDDTVADRAGAVYVYFGRDGSNPIEGVHEARSVADYTIDGSTESDFFGSQVEIVDDLNADGYHDIVVGAMFAGDKGFAYVFYGGENFTALSADDADASIEGSCSYCGLGEFIVSLGDYNADGYGDFAFDEGYANENKGNIYVFFGGSASILGTLSYADAGLVLTGSEVGDYLPRALLASDIDNDGAKDIIAGMTGVAEYEGLDLDRVYVFYGEDGMAQSPLFHEPVITRGLRTLSLNYVLPEEPLSGSVQLIFDNNAGVVSTVQLSDEIEVDMTLQLDDILSSLGVLSSSTSSIPDGVYTITLSYQDLETREATASFADMNIDTVIPLAVELAKYKHHQVIVKYDNDEIRQFTLFTKGSAKAKATLHTNGRIIIAVSKRYMRTFDAYTGDMLDQKKLFAKKQSRVKMKRFHVYPGRSANTVAVLAKAFENDSSTLRLRTFQVRLSGEIVRKNIAMIHLTLPVKRWSEMRIDDNGSVRSTMRLYILQNDNPLNATGFGITKTGSLKPVITIE